MGFFSKFLFGRKKKGTRSNPFKPHIPLHQPAVNSFMQQLMNMSKPSHYATAPIPNSSGYVLLTNKKDHDNQMMGRHLEFDSNRGFLGRGEPETVKLDGHVIWKGQIRNTSIGKLKREFFDDWDIQVLTRTQVQDIMAEEDDDPQMFGATAQMDDMMEEELEDLREELEAEYVERFEEDYQRRFKQEYPAKFSKDYQEHYNDMVVDEIDEIEDDYEDLYEEYIVSDQHIRYKR